MQMQLELMLHVNFCRNTTFFYTMGLNHSWRCGAHGI